MPSTSPLHHATDRARLMLSVGAHPADVRRVIRTVRAALPDLDPSPAEHNGDPWDAWGEPAFHTYPHFRQRGYGEQGMTFAHRVSFIARGDRDAWAARFEPVVVDLVNRGLLARMGLPDQAGTVASICLADEWEYDSHAWTATPDRDVTGERFPIPDATSPAPVAA